MTVRDLPAEPGYLAALAVLGPAGEVVACDGSALLASAARAAHR
jgi:hypothetical protein